jgi:peptidyl-prolyl cis-trans isomerase D
VLAGIGASGFAPNSAADIALNAYFEKREIQLARFNAADFAAKLNPTDADLEQFYKANEKLFQAPEQASIEYVLLDMDSVKKELTVNEADLKTYYEQNASAQNRRARASHILIASPKTAPAADREKAKAKAQELLALVKKSPDTSPTWRARIRKTPARRPRAGTSISSPAVPWSSLLRMPPLP